MTRNRRYKNAPVERYHGQHQHVGEPDPNGVEAGPEKTHSDPVRTGLYQVAAREPLDENGQREDEDQGQGVHDPV